MLRGLLVVLFLGLAGCGSGSDSSTATSSSIPPSSRVTIARTTTTATKCRPLDPSTKEALSITAGAAIMGPHGIANPPKAWIVTDDKGALWVTNADPTNGRDDSGLTLPLNAKARATSELGADVKDGANAYNGYTEANATKTGILDCPTS